MSIVKSEIRIKVDRLYYSKQLELSVIKKFNPAIDPRNFWKKIVFKA